MKKYILSQRISIECSADYQDANIPLKYRQDYYILTDQIKDREYLINQTIKYFLDKFSSPKTLAEVIQEIAREIHCDNKKIKKQCADFFKFLRHRKMVVPESQTEHPESNLPLFKAGDCVDDLCISEVISSKKSVDIYRAVHKTTHEPYVIKLLNPNKVSDQKKYEEELLDLKHEFNMLQKIRHIPLMCQAYSFHTIDNQYTYILLENIQGKSISRFLKQTADLTDFDFYSIIEDILRAFSCLHESNIVHGDIHPSNILVCEDKSVKIIDLGLSLDTNVEKDEMVKMGGVLFYMPPERINISSVDKFSKEPDYHSDVYQLGLILYFIFYRKEPFEGFIWEELSENIKKSEVTYPELSFLNRAVHDQVIRIIQKCISKKPAKRYADATALLEDFNELVFKKEVSIS